MKRPLCSVALLYVGGILLGQWWHPPLIGLFLLTLAVLFAALLWSRGRAFLLAPLLILTGWTSLSWHTAVVSPNDLRLLLGSDSSDVELRGALCASPTPRLFLRNDRELWHSSVIISVREISLRSQWQPAFGKVIATVPSVLPPDFFIGQEVEVRGNIHPPRGPLAEGLFDARAFYEHEDIYYQLQTPSASWWSIVPVFPPLKIPLSDRFSAWARKTLALGLPVEDKAVHLLWTLVLDWKAPLTPAVVEPFTRAGTYHIFAVDGLRIGLMAIIGIALLRVLQLPRWICGLLLIPIIWFYVGITGWPASAVRAAIMISIVIAGWAAHRPGDLLNSLFAAAFIILLWNPQELFQPGFQFSFLVVFCIALLLPVIREILYSRIFKKDPFLPRALQSQWPPLLHAGILFIIDTFALSLAAWLGSIPLAAAYFHVFTPVSLPANLAVVPLTGLALMSGIGSLLVGGWFPGLAVLFNHAGWFFMTCIIQVTDWAARLPSASFNVATPSTSAFLLYCLILLTVATGWIFQSRLKWAASAVILGLAACWLTQREMGKNTAHLHFLTLSGGSAVFVDEPAATENILFDCGGPASAQSILEPFLCAQGVNALDSFCLTVGHQQFVGGAKTVVDHFSVGRLLLTSERDRSSDYRALIDDLKKKTPWQALSAGQNWEGWSILHPSPSSGFSQADDNALVFCRTINGHAILLLSALGRSGQDSLIEHYPKLRAEIVAADLPATDEPLCQPLLEMLQPKLIIIIDSDLPATRRAPAGLRERLARSGARVIYCRKAGSVKLNLRRGAWDVCDARGETLLRE